MPPTRAIVAWVPDWPVAAAQQAAGRPQDTAVALIERGRVFACSAQARSAGVARGLRLREAQTRCPDLVTMPYDPALDIRAFEPLVAALEKLVPGVQVIRPGLCAVRARGPSRFYHGEERAAETLLESVREHGVPDCRVGIADGLFAAQQAARRTGSTAVRIIEPGESPRFLAPLPIDILGDDALTTLLVRLGMPTLGAFAALDAAGVRHRFGEAGARAHALAGGTDASTVIPRTPQKELDAIIEFEPPLTRIDQVTFAIRSAADGFIARLTDNFQVCTSIVVTVHSESGEVSERTWSHPRWFTPADVVDRVRWQLHGSGSAAGGLTSAVARVSVAPGSVDAIGNHEEGLWGTAPDERIHHGLSRVQGLLGHDAVLTATVGGGRMLADRHVLVPWGDRSPDATASSRPWPGSLPAPLPPRVFAPPRPASVLDRADNPVTVTSRGLVQNPPAHFSVDGAAMRAVAAWAGPWPIDERWWDASTAHRVQRFQVLGDDGCAWLLLHDGTRWFAEACYD